MKEKVNLINEITTELIHLFNDTDQIVKILFMICTLVKQI